MDKDLIGKCVEESRHAAIAIPARELLDFLRGGTALNRRLNVMPEPNYVTGVFVEPYTEDLIIKFVSPAVEPHKEGEYLRFYKPED